jgi:hypothetical protein
MSAPSEIDLVSRDVVSRTKEIAELSQAWNGCLAQLSQLCEALGGEASSAEVKQKFQLSALDVAEKGASLGARRKELREVTTRLLDMVKSDGRENLTTLDGVELSMSATLKFKFPSLGEEEKKEGGSEKTC